MASPLDKYRDPLAKYRGKASANVDELIRRYTFGPGSSGGGVGVPVTPGTLPGLLSNPAVADSLGNLRDAQRGMEVFGVNVDKPVQFLEWAGDIIDTPGSALRATVSNWATSFEDLISGEADLYDINSLVNPVGWIGSALADTVLGNEMNEQQRQVVTDFWDNTGAGEYLQRTIDEKGWQDTPLNNEFVKGTIGLAGDIGLDPLTYVTFGAGALGRTAATTAAKGAIARATTVTDDAGKAVTRWAASEKATEVLGKAGSSADDLAKRAIRRDATLTSDALQRPLDDIVEEQFAKLSREEIIDRAAGELALDAGSAYRRGGNITLRKQLQRELGDDLGNELFDAMPSPVRGGVRFFGQEITPMRVGNTRLGGGRLLEQMGPLGRLGENLYTGQVQLRNRLVSGPLAGLARNIGESGAAITSAKRAAAGAGVGAMDTGLDQILQERLVSALPERALQMDRRAAEVEKTLSETWQLLQSTADRTGDRDRFLSRVGDFYTDIRNAASVNVDELNDFDRLAFTEAGKMNEALQNKTYRKLADEFGEDFLGDAGVLDDARRVATDAEADRAAKREGVGPVKKSSDGLRSRERFAMYDTETGETRWMSVDEINTEAGRERFTSDPQKIFESVGSTLRERVRNAAGRKVFRDLGVTVELSDELAMSGRKLAGLVGREADRMARQAERNRKQADDIVANPNLAGQDAARVAANPDLADAVAASDSARFEATRAAAAADLAERQADEQVAASAAARATREAEAATKAATSRERGAEARLTRLRAQRDRKAASAAREQIEAARQADQAAEQAKVANRQAQADLRAARRNLAEERARIEDAVDNAVASSSDNAARQTADAAEEALSAAEQVEIAAAVRADMAAADWSAARAQRDIARAGDPNVPSAQKVQELDDLIAVTEAELASARAARATADDKLAADLDALQRKAADARTTSDRLTAEATSAATAAAEAEAAILRRQADEILTDVDRLRGVIRAAGTDPEPGGARYRALADSFMRMQKARVDEATAQLNRDMATAAKQARIWEQAKTGAVSDDAAREALVGLRVKANDRGNFGTIVAVDGDTAEVLFVNKAKGTDATRRFKIDDLEPRLLEQARLKASQGRDEFINRMEILTNPNLSIAEQIAAPGSPFDRLGTVRIRGKRVEVDPSLENDFAPTLVAEALTRMYAVRTTKGAAGFWELFYNPLEALWRTYATVARGPAYVFRNIIGGLWNGFLGGIGAKDVAAGKAHAMAIHNATKKAAEAIKNGDVNFERVGHIVDDFIAEELQATGIKVGGRGLDEWHQEMMARGLFVDSVSLDLSVGGNMTPDNYVTGRTRNLFPGVDTDKLGPTMQKWVKGVDWAGNNWWVRKMSTFAGGSETFLRTSQFYAGIRRYGNDLGPTMGDLLVKATQFDYGDVSNAERQLIRFGVPFFVWTKNNVPLQIRAMINQPGKVSAMLRINASVQQALASEEDSWANDLLPEWMREYMGVASSLAPQGSPLVLGLNNPLTDLNRFLTPPKSLNPVDYASQLALNSGDDVKGMMNPFLKAGVERISGTNTFTGREFEQTEAPGWYQMLAKLPFVPDTTVDPRTGQIQGSGYVMTQLRNLIPAIGQAERLVPFGPLASEKYQDRWVSSFMSQTVGAALPVTPVGTLTPDQMRGELSRQDREVSDQFAREAAARGLDPRAILRALRNGLTPEEVAEYIEQGFYRAAWNRPGG